MAFILIVDTFNNVKIPVLKGLPILARNSFAGGLQSQPTIRQQHHSFAVGS
jgi:hypothetical protein